MIPRLRKDGVLPRGIHSATIAEVLAAYPPRNQQRQILNDSLQRVISVLWALDTAIMIYVDGSYITSKTEPNDVDLLLITPNHTEPKILTYLNRVCPVEAVSVHVLVESATPNSLLDFMMTTPTNQAKGIIVLA